MPPPGVEQIVNPSRVAYYSQQRYQKDNNKQEEAQQGLCELGLPEVPGLIRTELMRGSLMQLRSRRRNRDGFIADAAREKRCPRGQPEDQLGAASSPFA